MYVAMSLGIWRQYQSIKYPVSFKGGTNDEKITFGQTGSPASDSIITVRLFMATGR
jgi:hypothetical protein